MLPLRRMFGAKRSAAREERDGPALLLSAAAVPMGEVVIRDESSAGARLACGPDLISDGVILVHLISGRAHRLALVWATAEECGVKYAASANLRVFVGEEWEPARRAWLTLGLQGARAGRSRG